MFSKRESQDLNPGSLIQTYFEICNAASLKPNQVSSGVTVSKVSNATFPNLSELKKKILQFRHLEYKEV